MVKFQVFDRTGGKIVEADIVIIDHGIIWLDDVAVLQFVDGMWVQNDGERWPRISITGGKE